MDLPIRDTPPPPHHQQQPQAPPPIPQLPPQLFTTAASLLDLTDKKLLTTLRDGTHLHGILRSWDQFGNLVLTQVSRQRFLALPAGTSLPQLRAQVASQTTLQPQQQPSQRSENEPPQRQQNQQRETDPVALLKQQLQINPSSTSMPPPQSKYPSTSTSASTAQPPLPPQPAPSGPNGIGIEGVDITYIYTSQPLGLYIIRGENIVLMGEIDLDRDEEAPPNSTYVELEEFEAIERFVKGGATSEGTAEKGRDVARTRMGVGGVGQKAREARRLQKLRALGFEGESSGDVIY